MRISLASLVALVAALLCAPRAAADEAGQAPAADRPAEPAAAAPSAPPAQPAPPAVRRPLGITLGATLARAPLGSDRVAPGLRASWRAWPVGFEIGAALGYDFASRAWHAGTVHAFSLQVLAGWQGGGAVAPFAEVSGGWLVLSVARAGGTQGDPGGFGGQLSAGARWSFAGAAVRAALTASGSTVLVDGGRTWFWQPGVELGVEL